MKKSFLKTPAGQSVKKPVAKSEAVKMLRKATDSTTPIGAAPSRTAKGSSSSHDEIPDWATFQPSVEVWWELLDEYGVDTAARQGLFALAQTNFEAANDVIARLIKKKNDGRKPPFGYECMKRLDYSIRKGFAVDWSAVHEKNHFLARGTTLARSSNQTIYF